MSTTTQAITALLAEYNDALNRSSTDTVMSLYMNDGVFMPPYSPSAVGSDAVRKAYDAVFAAIRLTVKFNTAEIVEMSPEWAFARTNSAGTTLNHATGQDQCSKEIRSYSFSRKIAMASSKLRAIASRLRTRKPNNET